MEPTRTIRRWSLQDTSVYSLALTRKLRKAGGSVALTIPRDFAAAMDLHVGDVVEIEPIDSQRLALRKAMTMRSDRR